MASLTEDELEAMEGRARKLTILDLKKRALAAKHSGDLETAMGCLKQAKKLGVEDSDVNGSYDGDDDNDNDDEPPYSSTLPLFWKKVALLCKQAGDIDRAKQALMHSKELEAATEIEPEEILVDSVTTKPLGGTSARETTTATETEIPNHYPMSETIGATSSSVVGGGVGNDPPPLYDQIDNFPPPPPPPPTYDNLVSAHDNLLRNCQVQGVANEEEAAMLAELMGGGKESGANTASAFKTPNRSVAKRESAYKTDVSANVVSTASNKSIADTINNNCSNTSMTFTDEELMDEEMMMEFAAGGVQGIPTQDEYAAKVLAYKKRALKYKQEGDIPKATQHLRFAKQLEKVALTLQKEGERSSMDPEADPQSWLDTLDPEESELLGELLTPSQGGGDDSLGASAAISSSATDKLTVEDLEEMDDDNDVIELVEMMGANALPTVEEVMAKITEEKQKALKCKQEGDIEQAKSCLLKSKKTKLMAMRLAEIYRKLEAKSHNKDDGDKGTGDDGCGSDDDAPCSMEALEALMGGGGSKSRLVPPPPPPKKPEPAKDPWLLKPSIAIKAEVIRLKNEKNVKEATRVLQLFKEKLAQEQAEVERKQVAKMVSTIQKRSEVSNTQRRLWQYYHWFGKETTVGADQYHEWTTYEKDCQKAIRCLETEGSTSVTLAPRVQGAAVGTTNGNSIENPTSNNKLYLLEDDITSLVESSTNETAFAAAAAASTGDQDVTKAPSPNFLGENALEVAILGLFEMENNEKLQKHLAKKPKSEKAISEEPPDLRIHAKLQLPIQPEDPSKPLLFDLEPSDLSLSRQQVGTRAEFKYTFDPSSKSCRKEVPLPRKDPKHERTLLRRIETKTLQLSVFCLHNQNKRKEAKEAAAAEASKRKSWFFGRIETKQPGSNDGASEDESKDFFLGKVIIDLKPLLSRGCLAGDFPILVNSKAIGGILRVCLRTRPILDPDRYEGLPWKPSDGAPASLSITTYKKGLSFTFPNEMNTNENSIESIKRESTSSSANTEGAK